jgi:hypothetical protein
MRHYPAYCTDCKRLWLIATDGAPSASPRCPRCEELGRLVPGAYYSDVSSRVFDQLEQAVSSSRIKPSSLGQLAIKLEQLLPSPSETEIEGAFDEAAQELGFVLAADSGVGKRVALRMLVTIATSLSQPVIRESGVMRLPQTIPGLFDLVPKKRAPSEPPVSLTSAPTPSHDELDQGPERNEAGRSSS